AGVTTRSCATSDSSSLRRGEALARVSGLQNFQVLAIRRLEFLRSGERVLDFERAIPFRLRLDYDAVAQHIAGDSRNHAALTAVETFGYAENDAEFAHCVHILGSEHILIAQ